MATMMRRGRKMNVDVVGRGPTRGTLPPLTVCQSSSYFSVLFVSFHAKNYQGRKPKEVPQRSTR